jgi:hypothetical protein
MVAQYSDGTRVDLGAKTAVYVGPSPGNPFAYAVSWTWTPPASAPLGDGTYFSACMYLGIERTPSSFNFTLIAP